MICGKRMQIGEPHCSLKEYPLYGNPHVLYLQKHKMIDSFDFLSKKEQYYGYGIRL